MAFSGYSCFPFLTTFVIDDLIEMFNALKKKIVSAFVHFCALESVTINMEGAVMFSYTYTT